MHQAEFFCQQLEQLGASVYRFPVMEIQFIPADEPLCTPTKPLDILIFTSSNAVHGALDTLGRSDLKHCKIAAIGRKTAQQLHQAGVQVDLQPAQHYNSEALLDLPELQHIAGKRILIVKGEGGRQHLQSTLTARGAQVRCLPVYRRKIPEYSPSILNKLQSAKIDIITLTSAESGINLFSLLDKKHYPWLTTATLILGSQRIHTVLMKKQLKNPCSIASNPSDPEMLTTVLETVKTDRLA